MNFGSIARREYSGRAITLGSVLLCADYLDLHVGQQGRQRPQGGQHRRYDGDRPADDHPGGEGDLHEHLVLLVADYDAAYVSLFYDLLGPIDQVACGDLDMLGKGMFVFLGGAIHFSGPFAHVLSPFALGVRVLCSSRSSLVWSSPPSWLNRFPKTGYFRVPSSREDYCTHFTAPGWGVTSDAGFGRRAARPLVAASGLLREALLARAREVHRDPPRSAAAPLRRSARRLPRPAPPRQGSPSPGARTPNDARPVGTLLHQATFRRSAVRAHRACWRRARRSVKFPCPGGYVGRACPILRTRTGCSRLPRRRCSPMEPRRVA